MNWLNSFFVAVITAIIAGTAGGFVAAAYVNWYRVSTREGQAGYTVIFFILLSAVIGFIAGLVLSRFADGFLKGLGTSIGVTLALAGIVALVTWMLADIPPTLNGHELKLVVEVRLPKGAERPPVLEGKQFLWFESGPVGAPARASRYAPLDVAKAQLIDGRWVIPGKVSIFTTRNHRFLSVSIDPTKAEGFELTFPGRPGPEYKQWSGWLPDEKKNNWPDSQMSYRFRIEEEGSDRP
jgi:hypothetical protein